MADPRIAQIEKLLTGSGKSVRWLAQQVGSTDTTVAHILNGETRNPRDPGIIARMLDALDQVPTTGERVRLAPRGMRVIPVASTIMAGPPSMNMADIEYEEVPDWGLEFERWGRTIEGESMLPVFRPGDIAIFENRRAENGHVVHAFKDGEDCIKVLRYKGDVAELHSFNSEMTPFSAEGWASKGVCVGRIRYKQYRIREFTDFPSGLSWAMREFD